MHKIDLYVDKDEKQSFIRRVRAGSNPNNLTIVVRQSMSSDSFLIWNMRQNTEEQQFDLTLDAQTVYDSHGLPYIAQDDFVIVCNQGVKLKCYHVENFKKTKQSLTFNYCKGHRFDNKNHNWILFSEYISLAFSFMTLVVRGNSQRLLELGDIEPGTENELDVEEYNFIINRRTFLTCDNFISEDHERLQLTLKKLEEVDPDLLEQVHYYYEIENLDQKQ